MSEESKRPDNSRSSSQSKLRYISAEETAAAKVIDLPLTGLNITAESFQLKNKDSKYEKPCEDYFVCDSKKGIFIVMDGATRYVKKGDNYPNPSPAAEAAAIFAESAYSFLLNRSRGNLSTEEFLLEAIKSANFAVSEYNKNAQKGSDCLANDYGNACGIIAVIENNSFYYTYLADPQGYLVRNNKAEIFTETQTEFIDNLEKISRSDPTFDFVEFRKQFCREVRNNKFHEHKFGSFTGEETALDLLESGSIALRKGDRIILSSDGLLPLFKKSPQILLTENYPEYLKQTEKIESENDIRSDDKTLIAIKIA